MQETCFSVTEEFSDAPGLTMLTALSVGVSDLAGTCPED